MPRDKMETDDNRMLKGYKSGREVYGPPDKVPEFGSREYMKMFYGDEGPRGDDLFYFGMEQEANFIDIFAQEHSGKEDKK